MPHAVSRICVRTLEHTCTVKRFFAFARNRFYKGTDLPLVVMPVIIESMIEPFEKNFELLKDIARVRMYKDFTLDEDTIVERCAEADAIMVIGFHCADSILDRLNAKCYAFGGTGVASYIDLDKAKERGIRVCNVVHYGDHAVAEHTIALLMELARQVGKLDRQVKTGDWDGADGYGVDVF